MVELFAGTGQFAKDNFFTVRLDDIRDMVDNPNKVDKAFGVWMIPSTLHSRTFSEQLDKGRYWMLWADFDDNKNTLFATIKAIVLNLFKDYDLELYTSRSAKIDNQKARLLIPLPYAISGNDYTRLQHILNTKLEALGIKCDTVNRRAGQLCYLPNRGDFYDSFSVRDGCFFDPLAEWEADLFNLEIGEVLATLDTRIDLAIRQRRNRARADEVSRYGKRASAIEQFNAIYTVHDVLTDNGYRQKGRRYCHPNSSSGSFSAAIHRGRVHSLSATDPLYTGGGGQGAHDAFSAYAAICFDGDQRAAAKAFLEQTRGKR